MNAIIAWILRTIFKNLKIEKSKLAEHIEKMDADKDGFIDCMELVDYLKTVGSP